MVRATAQAYSQQRNSIKGYTKLSSLLLSSSGLVHVNLLARVCVLVYVCECMCASVPVPLEVGYWPGWGGGSLQWRVESVPNMKVYPGSHNSSPPPPPPHPHFLRLKKVIAATLLRSMAPDPCLIIHTLFIQYSNNH